MARSQKTSKTQTTFDPDQDWRAKGYLPTADIRMIRVGTSKWLGTKAYLLKQRWVSDYGCEDVWLALPREENGEGFD